MSTLWCRCALLASGWAERVRIGIADARIERIEIGVSRAPEDEAHELLLPGMPNLHSHAFQRGMAGLTERAGSQADHFWSWRELLYRFVERLEPADVEAVSGYAFAEMLEAGFTRVAEFHYLHHDPRGAAYADPAELAQRVAAAAQASGIGLTLLPVLYAHGGFGGRAPTAGQRRFINDIEQYARLLEASRRAVHGLEDARVGVAPHSLRAVTPEELRAAMALAGEGPIHIHVAEQAREVDDCLAWSGRRPVEWLCEELGIDHRWCLVHATHVTAGELAGIIRSGATVGLCPITEANLGDGLFPAPAYLERGGLYGIGSDSNVLIDVASELCTLEYGQRLALERRNVLAQAHASGHDAHAGAARPSTGRALFEGAVRGGQRAVGERSMHLTPGAPADLVSLDLGAASLAARSTDALIDSWIFASRRSVVDCVWRGGRKLVQGGVHRERERLESAYRRTLARVLG